MENEAANFRTLEETTYNHHTQHGRARQRPYLTGGDVKVILDAREDDRDALVVQTTDARSVNLPLLGR